MTVKEVRWLPEAKQDLAGIDESTPKDADKIAAKVADVVEKIKLWGREPRTHSNWTLVSDPDIPDRYTIYRRWIGSGGYRLFAEISGEKMTIVAIRPKDSQTYENLEEVARRMESSQQDGGGDDG